MGLDLSTILGRTSERKRSFRRVSTEVGAKKTTDSILHYCKNLNTLQPSSEWHCPQCPRRRFPLGVTKTGSEVIKRPEWSGCFHFYTEDDLSRANTQMNPLCREDLASTSLRSVCCCGSRCLRGRPPATTTGSAEGQRTSIVRGRIFAELLYVDTEVDLRRFENLNLNLPPQPKSVPRLCCWSSRTRRSRRIRGVATALRQIGDELYLRMLPLQILVAMVLCHSVMARWLAPRWDLHGGQRRREENTARKGCAGAWILH